MGMEAFLLQFHRTCQDNGAYCIGYNIDMKESAPKQCCSLTCGTLFDFHRDVITSVWLMGMLIQANITMKAESVLRSLISTRICAQDVQDKVMQAKADIEQRNN